MGRVHPEVRIPEGMGELGLPPERRVPFTTRVFPAGSAERWYHGSKDPEEVNFTDYVLGVVYTRFLNDETLPPHLGTQYSPLFLCSSTPLPARVASPG